MSRAIMYVPTIVEAQLTGRIVTIEKLHKGRMHRVELHRFGPVCRCFIDGAPVAWEALCVTIQKAAHSALIAVRGHDL